VTFGYAADGQLARRTTWQGTTVYWLHGDHLGSASQTTSGSGQPVRLQFCIWNAPKLRPLPNGSPRLA
jgi:hypothetical protein